MNRRVILLRMGFPAIQICYKTPNLNSRFDTYIYNEDMLNAQIDKHQEVNVK